MRRVFFYAFHANTETLTPTPSMANVSRQLATKRKVGSNSLILLFVVLVIARLLGPWRFSFVVVENMALKSTSMRRCGRIKIFNLVIVIGSGKKKTRVMVQTKRRVISLPSGVPMSHHAEGLT